MLFSLRDFLAAALYVIYTCFIVTYHEVFVNIPCAKCMVIKREMQFSHYTPQKLFLLHAVEEYSATRCYNLCLAFALLYKQKRIHLFFRCILVVIYITHGKKPHSYSKSHYPCEHADRARGSKKAT